MKNGDVTVPSVMRRMATLPYEGLLLLALVLIASFPFAGLRDLIATGPGHWLFQMYLFAVTASYFVWLWHHGGQTLPMKTWRIRIVTPDGKPLGVGRAFIRYLCSLIFYGPACVGLVLLCFPERVSPAVTIWAFLPTMATVLWARFDPDHQFLHDRMASTRIVSVTQRQNVET